MLVINHERSKLYTDVRYQPHDYLFGKETAGLPSWLLANIPNVVYVFPMGKNLRSLNLSNAVAIVLYEALRQQGFCVNLVRDLTLPGKADMLTV